MFQCKLTISSRCRGWRSENSSWVEWLPILAEPSGPTHHILANQSLPFSKQPLKWPREAQSCCSAATYHQWLRKVNRQRCELWLFKKKKKRKTRVLTRNHFSHVSVTLELLHWVLTITKKPRWVRKQCINNWNILSAPSKLKIILPYIDSINVTVKCCCYSCAQDLGVNQHQQNKMVVTKLNTRNFH